MSDQRARRQALRLVHATDTDMRGLPFKARFKYPGEADASDEEKMRRSRDEDTPAEKWTPTAGEVERYLPYLKKHIEIIDPKILVLLGSSAMNALINQKEVISKVRGKWIEKIIGKCKTSIIVTFHPAFLMRQPAQKKMAWVDLKMIREKKVKLKI